MHMWLSFKDIGIKDVDLVNQEVSDTLTFYNDWYQREQLASSGAVYCLNSLLEHYPEHEALLIRRAHFFNIYDVRAALCDLALVLDKNPQHEEALKLRASIYFKANDFELALVDLSTLLTLQSAEMNIPVLCRRGEVYYELGVFQNALNDFNVLLQRTDFNSEMYQEERIKILYLCAKIFFSQEKYALAQRDLNSVLAEEYRFNLPHDLFKACLLLRSQVHGAQGHLQDALVDANELLEKYPQHIEALRYRITLCEARNDMDQVTLDKYTIYRATHNVTKLQEARAMLAFYQPGESTKDINCVDTLTFK
ncbi:MAG: hypothetical protein P1U61_02675 [Legionellaceae bacterium]|nr:hypothetical protein [Legionellaceae bacterium]